MNTFILVPRGTRPRVTERGTVIEVPVRRAVLRSASHVPFFSMLGIADRIVGITQGRYVNDRNDEAGPDGAKSARLASARA